MDSTLQERYSVVIQNRFDQLGDLPEDVDDCWNSVSSTIRDTAGEVIGTRKKIRKPWLSADTFAIILKRKPVPMHIKITLRGSDFKGSSKQKPRLIVIVSNWTRSLQLTFSC